MPSDWRKLHLKSKVGVITIAKLELEENSDNDAIYASTAYYSAQRSSWFDTKLVWRWLNKKFLRR